MMNFEGDPRLGNALDIGSDLVVEIVNECIVFVVNQYFPYGRSVHVHSYYYPKCLLIITRVVYC